MVLGLPAPSLIPPGKNPTLKGMLKVAPDGTQVFEGKWAMTRWEIEHGMTNPFRMECKEAAEHSDEPDSFPYSGLYKGFFILTDRGRNIREDDESELAFVQNSQGGYNVSGTCRNKFGTFQISGTMSGPGRMEIFRVLGPIAPVADDDYTPHDDDEDFHEGLPAQASGRSTHPPSSTTPLQSRAKRKSRGESKMLPELKECKTLLNQVLRKPSAYWFKAPVDPVALNLPKYFDYIKHPMDFGTMKTKLDDGEYRTVDAFMADARLTLSNAMTYNGPDSSVYKAAQDLLAFIDQQAKVMASKQAQLIGRPAPARPAAAAPFFQELTKDQQETVSKDLYELFQKNTSADEQAFAYVAWSFLKSNVPESKRRVEHGEIRIPLDALSVKAQHQILILVKKWKAKSDSQPAASSLSVDASGPAKKEVAAAAGVAEAGTAAGGISGATKRSAPDHSDTDSEHDNSDSDADYTPDTKKVKRSPTHGEASGGANEGASAMDVSTRDAEAKSGSAVAGATAEAPGGGDAPKPAPAAAAAAAEGAESSKATTKTEETEETGEPAKQESEGRDEKELPKADAEEDGAEVSHETLQVIDTSAPADVTVEVSNVEQWVLDEEDSDAEGEKGEGNDAWSKARKEKEEKEKREAERQAQEEALMAERKLKEEKRASLMQAEAREAQAKKEEEAKRKKELEMKKAEEEKKAIQAIREQERQERENQEQEVDFDEIRGDDELMAIMDRTA